MKTESTSSAKQEVIAWVRERNPQTKRLQAGCRVAWGRVQATVAGFNILRAKWEVMNESGNILPTVDIENAEILGTDMGKQEFEIALKSLHGKEHGIHVGWHSNYPFGTEGFFEGLFVYHIQSRIPPYSHNIGYNLTLPLHRQDESDPEFFEAMLPLVRSVRSISSK